MQCLGMSRGVVVLDENLNYLYEALRRKNFHIISPDLGELDEKIIEKYLPGRIFITNNPKDFTKAAVENAFGIIVMPFSLTASPQYAADLISDAICAESLWSIKKPFILKFKDGGAYDYRLLD
jgi:hypothetical protein